MADLSTVNLPDASETQSIYPVGTAQRHVAQMIGRAINQGRWAIGINTWQSAYARGESLAAADVAASFAAPGDEQAQPQITAMILARVAAGARNTETDRARIIAAAGEISDPPARLDDHRDVAMHAMLKATVTAHDEAGPDVPSGNKSPNQWMYAGMRNGYVDGAAQWANPASRDTVRTTQAIAEALNDGIRDLDELSKVATGQLHRDDLGNWIDEADQYDEDWGV